MSSRKTLLAIAGFDPTGGAGIISDAAVFRTLGFHPTVVLTSVAAQGSNQVAQILPLPENFIQRELGIVFSEFHPAAIKIGMLYSSAAVQVVAAKLKDVKMPIVLDPILKASSGGALIQPEALPFLETQLIPHCQVITPNLSEAEFFLKRSITTTEQAAEAAQNLSQRWKTAVLLKGGHLPGSPVDFLAEGNQVTPFPHSRRAAGINLRGTGCALSAALAAGLASDLPFKKAVLFAQQFLQKAIEGFYQTGVSAKLGFLNFSPGK